MNLVRERKMHEFAALWGHFVVLTCDRCIVLAAAEVVTHATTSMSSLPTLDVQRTSFICVWCCMSCMPNTAKGHALLTDCDIPMF
jgi:hypothetical protein